MNKRCVKESQIFSGHLGEFFGFSEIIIFHIFVLESRSNFVNRVPTVLRPSLSPTFLQAGSPRKPQRKVARRRRGKLCSFRWFWVGKSHFLLHRTFGNSKLSSPIPASPQRDGHLGEFFGLSTERGTFR